MTIQQKIKMTAAQFRDWAVEQPRRYELVDGEPIAMAPERALHNRVKGLIFRVFLQIVERDGLACEVFTDGMSVEVPPVGLEGWRNYEPDVSVQCGVVQDLNSMVLPAPLIVVEMSSPSSRRLDAGSKLTGYTRVASIIHYIVVLPDDRQVIHHRRQGDGFHTTVHDASAHLLLDPPGMTVDVGSFWPPVQPEPAT
ncbi:MAG: Uma2 family endonuclease [Hyphomicrobium aestuarii]|nr:Uma2 family endonuclease [Hyphomicrobium aestuarii]